MTSNTEPTAVREPVAAKLSLLTLTALVVGSMVGAGVFSLPSRFATETGVVGALIAWASDRPGGRLDRTLTTTPHPPRP